jgi:FAD/FMN-containing dehydrogenase
MKSIDSFLADLKNTLTSAQILIDPESLKFFAQDWSAILTPNASAILFPHSTTEVELILKTASKYKIAIVPSGGRTGLSGGAVATNGEVVLSLSKLNFIRDLNARSLTLHVGAGAITEAVHEFCEPHGFTWPVDFASKGSSTVGGNIATNAGGVRVIRYGNTRNWILGLTAVNMHGQRFEFNGELEKNNTGYDFRQLLSGSEGTLAVITEATLKLHPSPSSRLVFFFALENFANVLKLFEFVRKKVSNLSAFECLDHASLNSVLTHFSLKAPFKDAAKVYALIEVESFDAKEDQAASLSRAHEWLSEIFESGFVLDGVMAQNEKEAKELWRYREAVAESIFSGHLVHQEDVSVPVSSLEKFYSEIETRYAEEFPEFKVFFFGHIGDGNLHIFVQKPESMAREEFITKTHASDLELFKVLKQYQGSVSAEHGVGILKKHALEFTRSLPEIALMKSVKKAFDPENLLNPGKIF